MSDVVNMEENITHDGYGGAAIYDWLQEQPMKLTQRHLNASTSLHPSHLNLKTGRLATTDVLGDEMRSRTKADSYVPL